MLNKLGHVNGDIPKYLDWKLKPRRMRSSLKWLRRSESSERHGRRSGNSLSMSSLARVLQLVAIATEEAVEAAGIARAELSDRTLHTLQVRCGQQPSARAEDQPVVG